MSQLCLYHHITCMTWRGLLMLHNGYFHNKSYIYCDLWSILNAGPGLFMLLFMTHHYTLRLPALQPDYWVPFVLAHDRGFCIIQIISGNYGQNHTNPKQLVQSRWCLVLCWPGQGPKEGIRVSAAPSRCTSERSGHFGSVGITGSMLTWC